MTPYTVRYWRVRLSVVALGNQLAEGAKRVDDRIFRGRRRARDLSSLPCPGPFCLFKGAASTAGAIIAATLMAPSGRFGSRHCGVGSSLRLSA